MVEIKDPITGTDYDPLSDPTGTLTESVGMVIGIGMTLVLFMVARQTLLPTLSGVVEMIPGVETGTSDSGFVTFGGS